MYQQRAYPPGGLANLVQTKPGALANHWTTQSCQGVWGPCVPVRQTGDQAWTGWAGAGLGSQGGTRVEPLDCMAHTAPGKLPHPLLISRSSTATAAKTADSNLHLDTCAFKP